MCVFVWHILDFSGWFNRWTEQCTTIFNVWKTSAAIKQRLQDHFIRKWANNIDNPSKGQIPDSVYTICKQTLD